MIGRFGGLLTSAILFVFAFLTGFLISVANLTAANITSLSLGGVSNAEKDSLLSSTGADYRLIDGDEWVEIAPGLDDYQLGIVEKINRTDRQNLHQRDRLILPGRWFESELCYSPLPLLYSWARLHKKLIVVSLTHQVFGAYENGCLVYWGPVSSGRREYPTPPGLFHLNWKSRGRTSTLNRNWFLPWYFNFHNKRGLSFHQYELPGYPASHACLRLLERDARWLYDWGESWELGSDGMTVIKNGTPVVIFGQFEWDEPPPWLSLDPQIRNVVPPALPE